MAAPSSTRVSALEDVCATEEDGSGLKWTEAGGGSGRKQTDADRSGGRWKLAETDGNERKWVEADTSRWKKEADGS